MNEKYELTISAGQGLNDTTDIDAVPAMGQRTVWSWSRLIAAR